MNELTEIMGNANNELSKSEKTMIFRGIWIPKEYLQDQKLSNQECLLLATILALCNNKLQTCYASNHYFKNILGIGCRRIQQLLANLKQKAYLEVSIENKKGVKNYSRRRMKIISSPPCKNIHPYNKEDNNTFSFKEKLMNKVFDSWLRYRDELNRPLTNSSSRASFKKLQEISGNDPNLAKQIVDQAIGSGWLALYPLKNEKNNKPNAKKLPAGVVLNSQVTDNFNDYDF